MIRIRRPGTNVVYPSLGIAATRGTGYPRTWRISIARISPATPGIPSCTPSSGNIWSPSCGKPPTGATDTACPASSSRSSASSSHAGSRPMASRGFGAADCTFERLVTFSCKRRGFCPSCGGRRMAERAAYLVDAELPQLPVTQWVLTLPYRLRYRLAWDHALCRAVLGVYARGLLAFYTRTARSHGIHDSQTGTVTVIQRFGSGLQLNVHFHTLVLNGVFSEARPGPLTFHPAPPPREAPANRAGARSADLGQQPRASPRGTGPGATEPWADRAERLSVHRMWLLRSGAPLYNRKLTPPTWFSRSPRGAGRRCWPTVEWTSCPSSRFRAT